MTNINTIETIKDNATHAINNSYKKVTRWVVKYEGEQLISKLKYLNHELLGMLTIFEFTTLSDIRNELFTLHEHVNNLITKENDKIYNI